MTEETKAVGTQEPKEILEEKLPQRMQEGKGDPRRVPPQEARRIPPPPQQAPQQPPPQMAGPPQQPTQEQLLREKIRRLTDDNTQRLRMVTYLSQKLQEEETEKGYLYSIIQERDNEIKALREGLNPLGTT